MRILWWGPISVIYFVLCALLSHKVSVNSSTKQMWFLYAFGGLIQMWPFVAINSKNLLIDGLLYDLLMVTSYIVTICVLEKVTPTPQQIVGMIMMGVGLCLVHFR